MRILILFLLPCLSFAQLPNSCINPDTHNVRVMYVVDMGADDDLNTTCYELTKCIRPFYDEYFAYRLFPDVYNLTVIPSAGVDSAYLAVLDENCDTAYAEFCGVLPVSFDFTIPVAGWYKLTINNRSGQTYSVMIDNGTSPGPVYLNPINQCTLYTAITEPIMAVDSRQVLQYGPFEWWHYLSASGNVIGVRKFRRDCR